MIETLAHLVKVTLVLAAGLAAARLASRTRASIRHAGLAAALMAAAATPIVTAVLPPRDVSIARFSLASPTPAVRAEMRGSAQAEPHNPNAGSVSGAGLSQANPISRADTLMAIWVIGGLIFASPLALSLWRLSTLRRHGLPWPHAQAAVKTLAASADVSRTIAVVTTDAVPAPFTFGVIAPVIVLPEAAHDWDPAALNRAILHELAHIRRGDWWTQLAGRAVCALYWFHPLAWRVYRQLSVEAERACDDEVLTRDAGTDYADQLVALARHMSAGAAPLVGMANRSDLATRVAAVLDADQPRGRMRTAHIATIAVATIVGLAAIAPLRAVARAAALDGLDQTRSVTAPQTRRTSRLDRALVEAAGEGDLDEVRARLDAGADVNAAVDGDGSPLIAAARAGNHAIVTLLLDRGADINLGVEGDGNPLIMAAAEGHLEIVDLLLARGADVNAVVPSDENALIQASGGGHLDIVQLLVSRGADVNMRIWADRERGGEWRTALSQARRGNHRRVIEYLQSVGAQ